MARGSDLVSIITPTFNAQRFLQQTIESVQAQTHKNWEMIVVDDRSRDDTWELASSLAQSDPRIKPIRHQQNQGAAAARNTGLAAAQGALVAFLDGDDLWLPHKLERQLLQMREDEIFFSYTAFRRINEDGTMVGRLRPIPAKLGYRDLLKNTAIVTSSVLIDRAKIGDFRMPAINYEDFATWLSILKRGFVAHGLNVDSVRYRIAAHSLSRNKTRGAKWIWRVYRNAEQLSVAYASWCFANYAVRGFLKYRSL
jgi:teichuronic acid biosynthesis glycosyltransferase TuaG